jgi:hypothetical protein
MNKTKIFVFQIMLSILILESHQIVHGTSRCVRPVYGYLTKNYKKLTRYSYNDLSRVCQGLKTNFGGQTCCHNSMLTAITQRWSTCMKNNLQPSMMKFWAMINDSASKVQQRAKELLLETEEIKATPENKPKAPKKKRHLQSVTPQKQKTQISQYYAWLIRHFARKPIFLDKSFLQDHYKCYTTLWELKRGALCSYCSDETASRWGNEKKIYVSPADVQNWAMDCRLYIGKSDLSYGASVPW